jgi:Outer membrane protein
MRKALVFKAALFLGVISIFVPLPGTTGASAGQALSLEQAVSIALEKNLDVLSAREELAKAEGKLVYARSGLFPTISVNGSVSKRNEESTKPEDENVGNVSLSQYLYAGGVISAGAEQARQTQAKARQDLRNAEEVVSMKVFDAYVTVLLRKADEETARDALSYYENSAKELGKRFELGLAKKLDYSRAVQQRESASANYTRAKNNLSTARIDLLTLLRMPPDADVEITGGLEAEAASVNREESVVRALEQRPDLQGQKTIAAIQKTAVDIARGGMRPVVTLSASYQFAYDSTPASTTDDDEWLATVSMKVPVFDGGTTRGRGDAGTGLP